MFIGQTSNPLDQSRAVIKDADCDPTVSVGDWVYTLNGICYKAIANDFSKCNVLGVIERKPVATKCDVRFFGLSDRIFSGLDETKLYYLSDVTSGAMQDSPVTTSGNYLLSLGLPFGTDRFVVNIKERTKRS